MPRHPVHQLLAECAFYGRRPTTSELDELKLASNHRDQVRSAADAAVAIHADDRGQAHEHALRSSHAIIAALPDDQRDPAYLCEPQDLEGLGPLELAALVPRSGYAAG